MCFSAAAAFALTLHARGARIEPLAGLSFLGVLLGAPFLAVFITLMPRRGSGSHRVSWLPHLTFVAGLWLAGATWHDVREVAPGPLLAAPFLAALGGALRLARPGDVTPLRDTLLRAALGAGGLFVVRGVIGASTWLGGWPCNAIVTGPAHGAWPTTVVMPFAIACDVTVALSLTVISSQLRATRRRAGIALWPVWGVVSFALSRLVVDAVTLLVARDVLELVVTDDQALDPGRVELLAVLADAAGGVGLSTSLAIWGASFASLRRSEPLALVGWTCFGPIIPVVLVMTSAVHAPAPITTTTQRSMPASGALRPLVREARGTVTPRRQTGELLADGTVILDASGNATLLVDERSTLDQLVDGASRFQHASEVVVAWRTSDLSSAPRARRRWGFVEATARGLAGREIILTSSTRCGGEIVIAGARYDRCRARLGEQVSVPARARDQDDSIDVLLLRDTGALSVDAWLESIADLATPIALDRASLEARRVEARFVQRDEPILSRVGFEDGPWAWLLGTSLVALTLFVTRGDTRAGRVIARAFGVARRAPGEHDAYRSAPPRALTARVSARSLQLAAGALAAATFGPGLLAWLVLHLGPHVAR